MFAYCLNNPVNCIDSDGHDAIWIHEGGSAAGFGHSGLLIQDDKGKWHYFYWGPKDTSDYGGMLLRGTQSYCVVKEVTVSPDADLTTAEGIKAVLIENFPPDSENDFMNERIAAITDCYYFEGDYNTTLQFVQLLYQNQNDIPYHLLFNNCAQNTWRALACSDDCFRLVFCPTIPDLAFYKVLVMHGEFSKSLNHRKKEFEFF